ncbi:IPT/TIG domain-containing protein [Aquimarina sp. 2201CG5-10]|uniref:IPT/TIG domain-containing protein n=1 Tax=Aquimarina callyspongiae TaxID=3098150 RepID=UPI002AB37CD0|nr:IPT/TIG domain-containing protein [Aquimarina sp. 2201CG5-10]MDY8137951.1 hypothetical protein [Aquimarina sp. 2201CG5-10]
MKKILSLFVLSILIISCSSDDSTVQEDMMTFPTDLTFAQQEINIGEILTITGNGFSSSETYIVTFTGNVTGTINEINANFLKVEVPQNAQSGDVTLRTNNTTQVIGNLVIVNNNTNSEEVYIYQESAGALAQLNIETGGITYVSDIIPGGTTIGAVYDSQNNEYIVFRNNTDPSYARVNLTTGNVTYEVMTSPFIVGDGTDVFSAPVTDNNGNIYLLHESANVLSQLNTQTGELRIITDGIVNGGTIIGAIYDSQNNEYIFFSNNADPNYARVNIATGDITYEVMTSPFIVGDGTDVFSAPVIDNNGNIYLLHESANVLTQLNSQTGELNIITDGIVSSGTTIGAIYDSQSNEYIVFRNNADPNYARVNIATGDLTHEIIDPTVIVGDGSDVFSGVVRVVIQ